MKISSHPAAVRASCWASGCWSRVETRPYPTRMARLYRERRVRDVVADTGRVTPSTWPNGSSVGVSHERSST